MYNLPCFKAGDATQVVRFMQEHPFVTLAGVDVGGKPVATHVPVLVEERPAQIFLTGHMMKQTDHHQAFLQNSNILAIFTAPHTYVSASWYVNQQQGSTWNYQTVHAKGIIKFLDQESLLRILSRTTAHFEKDEYSPSLFEKLPDDYVQKLVKAIVAFEIVITDLDHVFKLSQDRDKESYNNIIDQLKKGDLGAQHIAEAMQNNNHPL